MMPYRRSADVLRKTSAIDITHQTIWRLVAKVADPYLKKTEQELKWFHATGEIPASDGKQVARLMVEADGVMLSLQREKERKTEIPSSTAFANAEQDWRMPLILQGKDFTDRFPFISAT